MMKLSKPGNQATAGIIAPAYIPVKERLERGIGYLEQRGIRVRRGETLGREHGYFAGNDEQRLSDLHRMYRDPEVDMIICARGGWGGLRMVDRIDYDLISAHPKPLIGYSDITTLQLAIWTRTGLPALSGPMVAVEMGKGIDLFTEEHFWGQVYNHTDHYKLTLSECGARVGKAGSARGVLLGGCLSMVTGLLGTPYAPDYADAILFLEDVGEKPYKIDRYFAQLKQAGILDQISGLILGIFDDCQAEAGEVSFTLSEILEDYTAPLEIPVILDFPYGHIPRKVTMPIGSMAGIDTSKGQVTFSNIFH